MHLDYQPRVPSSGSFRIRRNYFHSPNDQELYRIPTIPATQKSNTLGVAGFIDVR
jgi:hypothetical protein